MPTKTVTSAPPAWGELEWPVLGGVLLCVDQSLVNSGWALLHVRPGLAPRLAMHGTIHTAPSKEGRKGFYDTFVRSEQLYEEYRKLLEVSGPQVVLHEMPAITGMVAVRRQEASTMAGVALRCAARSLGLVIDQMQAQHVKKIMTGNGNAPKPFVREQVVLALPDATVRWNEHISDAVALGITAILDGTAERLLKGQE